MRNGYLQELARQVAKDLGRDETRKRRIEANLAQAGFALDAASTAEMSARELAVHVLRGFGAPPPADGVDPLEALDYFLLGRRTAGIRGSAQDAAMPTFLDKYLNGGK